MELDSLHWQADWREENDDVFRNNVTNAVSGERWVVDGDYSRKLGPIVSARATTTIWLDPSLTKILTRFFTRSLKRSLTRQKLWNGNRETLAHSLFAKDSLLKWILQNHKPKQQKLAGLAHAPPPGQTVIRLKTQKDVRDFLAKVTRA